MLLWAAAEVGPKMMSMEERERETGRERGGEREREREMKREREGDQRNRQIRETRQEVCGSV
jgi:hypothetical protein